MSFRSLLLFLDQDPRCQERTLVAIELARALDCHLVGLAPTGRIEFPLAVETTATASDFVARAWGLLHEQAQAAATRLRTACAASGLRSVETVVVEGDKAPALIGHAHCSDLTILGQPDPGSANHLLDRDTVERVVLQSARPTLVVPFAGRFASLGRQVLVAWDDSREATRAIADAMPLLQRADKVQVVAWRERESEDAATVTARLQSLERWLLWHGVSAQVIVERTRIPLAEAILSRAADLQADLLVMGAYGHARLAERVLGGATRGVLDSMTLPVLMSH